MLDEMSHKIIGQNALLPPPRDLSCGARPNPYGMIFGARPGQTTDDQDDVLEFVVRPSEPVTEKPPLYKVVILNDDYTPMGFVIHVLQRFFWHGRTKGDADYVGHSYFRQRSLWYLYKGRC